MNILIENAHLKRRVRELESGHAELAAALIESLESLDGHPDPEQAHKQADTLVSKFIRDIGHKQVANTWDAAREGWFYG